MLKSIELSGFKSFAKRTHMHFPERISAIVGPNGSGKSNAAEAFRFALGEQSMKSLRGKRSDDLLWNGSSQLPRANRAGVKVLFDNNKNILDVDFDDVAVERVMHRDSSHQYFINDSQVRLKDVQEMLASANIGPTGHHIISQGEADRILSVKPDERKRIIEDALGLKIYHYKKRESERKLQKTQDNLEEIVALQREIEPQLRSLSRRMSRIKKARELRDELKQKSKHYFASREYYIRKEEKDIKEKQQTLEEKKKDIIEQLESITPVESSDTSEIQTLKEKRGEYEKKLREIVSKRHAHERTIGRLEGSLEILQKKKEKVMEVIPRNRLKQLKEDVLEALEGDNTREKITSLFEVCLKGAHNQQEDTEEQKRDITEKIQEERKQEEKLQSKEQEAQEKIASLQKQIDAHAESGNGNNDRILSLRDEKRKCESQIENLKNDLKRLDERRHELREDVTDAGIVFGREIVAYEDLLDGDFTPLAKDELRTFNRSLERGRIKIEDADLGSARETEREYADIKERNDFLQKEIDDLRSTRESLIQLIRDLEKELSEKFRGGVEKINKQFDHFFSMLFGGGAAQLVVIREEKENGDVEEGVEIDVQLPRKRVKGLAMLSGGERALTSIALVFSISYINPPPFLILDETDAALDEANSRKYGDMIEDLSKQSQLILVTHNRETMSRAGLLYGVTMGADGVSRLLSVKFEDAKEMAAR